MEKKRKGAPPGNTNALKHGFYSQRFRQMDDNAETHPEGLAEEIKILRVLIRLVNKNVLAGEPDSDTLCKLLGMISLSTYRLSRLLEAQKNLVGDGSFDFASALSLAINEATQELFTDEAGDEEV
ncbi:MAG: hypothetical protein MUO76_14040 [Anaerolineaceae bacterium]|nr:hypothetical protein [Anaerolineaceae bacterium]